MSEKDMAKLFMTTVAEVVCNYVSEALKQLSLEGNKMEHSNSSNSVKLVLILKKDKLYEFMAWSDVIQGLILVTDCSLAIDEKKMNYMMGNAEEA